MSIVRTLVHYLEAAVSLAFIAGCLTVVYQVLKVVAS